MKETKIMTVLGVEVVVDETTLTFTKDGEEIVLERKLGRDDYRLVRNRLLSKGRVSSDYKKVGNFEYKIVDNFVEIRRIETQEIIESELELSESQLKYPRNFVMNYLVSNL